jgi:hypothetical protein
VHLVVVLVVLGGVALVVYACGYRRGSAEGRLEEVARDYFERHIRYQKVVAETYTLTINSMEKLDYDITDLAGCDSRSYVVIRIADHEEADPMRREYTFYIQLYGCG